MADEQVVTETAAPVVETVKVEAPKVEVKQEDLVSRVSKVKVEAPKPKEDTNPFGLSKEDYDRVQNDPSLSKFYKSMQSDYVKKTQEVAEQRRKAEDLIKQSQTWTAERLAQEVNKPDFIQAAQIVASQNNPPNSGLTEQEYSALTDKEKAQLHQQNQRISELELQNWQMLQKQQDEQLKSKYANYAPDIVDTTVKQLVRGEVKANREYVWKAIDYDDAVQRAYELGKQDKQLDNKEKQQALSPEGFATTPSNDIPQPEKNESNTAYFKRLALRRLAEAGRQVR